MKIDSNTAVFHTIPVKGTPRTYLVGAAHADFFQRGGICYHFIAIADSADKAIEATKANALAVISKIRSQMKPEDFEKHQLYREPSFQELQRANALATEIQTWESELAKNEDREDELYQIRRETLTDNIKENYARIKKLRSNKPTEEAKSKFERIVSRMTEMLSMTNWWADELNPNRVYPVSYFDDSRSITNYVP